MIGPRHDRVGRCPACFTLGIPSTPCMTCVLRAHEGEVRRAAEREREALERLGPASVHAKVMNLQADQARAARMGAALLLDHFGLLLLRVGFELPGAR